MTIATVANDALQEDISPKQTHLIRHTYRLIGAKGMSRVTLQDIADAAGVSKAVIVYYFKTKEALVLKTMRWVLAQVAERIEQTMTNEEAPAERVRAMIEAIFVDAKRNRNFYLAYTDLVNYAAHESSFHELNTTMSSIVNSFYAEVIRSGAGQGAFQVEDVEQAATVMRAIVDGIFLLWLQEKDWSGTHAYYKELCSKAVLTYLCLEVPSSAHRKGRIG